MEVWGYQVIHVRCATLNKYEKRKLELLRQSLLLLDEKEYFYCCNWTRTQNHLVLKRTLNHLAKLAFLLLYVIIFICCPHIEAIFIQIGNCDQHNMLLIIVL